MNKMKKILVAMLMTVTLTAPMSTQAAINDKGTDVAVYQGANGRFGYASDKFTICQIGGYNSGGLYNQWTYSSQVRYAINNGKRAHTYIWFDTWGSMSIAKTTMDYFLPKIETPKGSIVALDFEHGASTSKQANTDTILYGMRRIKAAGYTPMYYSYKPFTMQYVNYQQILAEFPNSLWMAAYPNYQVTPNPVWSVFPSMDGVAIYQFTSTYVAGGLDGNIDLTGITDSGYTAQPAPSPDPVPAPEPTPSPSNDFESTSGTYTFTVNTKIRNGVGVSGQDSGLTYDAGETVSYDRIYKNVDGYDWLSYISYSGQRRYVAMVSGSPSAPSTQAPTEPKRVAQTGTYRARSTMNVRTSPSTNAAVVATYSAG